MVTPKFRVVAHHVSHLFPDVVSEPMTRYRAEEAATRVPDALPAGALGWLVNVEPVGRGAARARHVHEE